MPTAPIGRRAAVAVLATLPAVAIALVALRDLRTAGAHDVVGTLVLVVAAAAIAGLGGRPLRRGPEPARRAALAGVALVAPFVLMAFLWVGLGTPWESTPVENRLRYLVLLAGTVLATLGFVALRETTREADERTWSAIGAGSGLLAGAAYLVWAVFQAGALSCSCAKAADPPRMPI